MGCAGSKQQKSQEDVRSESIDSKLRQDKHAAKTEIKLLLLGAGESGKTTIRNQMRYIDGQPLTEEEREQFTDVCRTNMIASIQTILDSMLLLGIELADLDLKASANLLMDLENESGSVGLMPNGELRPGILEAIVAVWSDPNVQHTAKERSNELQLNDSAEYFLDEAVRIGAPGWKPTDMDVLKARVKTVGVSETRFEKQGKKFIVVDVGGQRSERRKWLSCFDQVTCLLYVVALNEYNMVLREDETVNRMREAHTLFQSIVTSKIFVEVSCILFLNKADLLRRKCASAAINKKQAISTEYSEFNGDPTDWKQVFKFIEKLFFQALQGPDVKDRRIREKRIYGHLCTAVDRDSFRHVLASVNDTILRTNIEAAGLL